MLCGSFKSGFPSSTLVFHAPLTPLYFLKQDVYNSAVCTSDFLLFLPHEVVVKLETNRVICA